jgi:hypothetical protein
MKTEMEIKHTPGPWTLEFQDEEGHIIRMASAIKDPSCYSPCHCVDWNHGIERHDKSWSEANANATLMAESPALLKCLIDLVEDTTIREAYLRIHQDTADEQDTRFAGNYEAALSAIAKAEGKVGA